MSGATPLLSVQDLEVRFSGADPAAVGGISFEVERGEIRGLAGESGSGKSVTGLSLMGLTRELGASVSGRAILAGKAEGPDIDLIAADEGTLRHIRGSRIAMIFQDPLSSLNPFHRVGDQVAEAILAHGSNRDAGSARDRAVSLLGEVGIPDPKRRARAYPHEFSGGMRQRVMIAMALANEPDVLIADEPTTALDVTTQAQILDLIVRLRDSHGMAVILISHDLGVVTERADSVTVMRSGKIVEAGTVRSVFANPTATYTRELLAAIPRVDRSPARAEHRAQAAPATDSQPLVEVEDLTLTFPARKGLWGRRGEDVRAVDGVSLAVPAGSTLGIVGESGSGKSTLCRLMLRLLDPDSGSVRFAGREIGDLSQRELRQLRGSMQMVFQDPYSSLNPRHRIGSIVAAPIRLHGDGLSSDEIDRRVTELLQRVGLDPAAKDRFPHEFSGGQRQRIAIARALGPRPKLVVADEPVSALDVTIQAQILDLMQELQDELGLTYVFVSHDLGVIRQVADQVAVMRKGRVVETGSAEQICTAPRDAYTRTLLGAVPKLAF